LAVEKIIEKHREKHLKVKTGDSTNEITPRGSTNMEMKKSRGRPPVWSDERIKYMEKLIHSGEKIIVGLELKKKLFFGMHEENFLKKLKELADKGDVDMRVNSRSNITSQQLINQKQDRALEDSTSPRLDDENILLHSPNSGDSIQDSDESPEFSPKQGNVTASTISGPVSGVTTPIVKIKRPVGRPPSSNKQTKLKLSSKKDREYTPPTTAKKRSSEKEEEVPADRLDKMKKKKIEIIEEEPPVLVKSEKKKKKSGETKIEPMSVRSGMENAQQENVFWVWKSNNKIIYAFVKPPIGSKVKIDYDPVQRKVFKTVSWNFPKKSDVLKSIGESKMEYIGGEQLDLIEECTYIPAVAIHGSDFTTTFNTHLLCVFDVQEVRYVSKVINVE
jgi:hypothetical protein